jgi:hypothetical protein
MNIGVVGYGLIGKERVKALLKLQADGKIPINKIFIYDPYNDPVYVHPNVYWIDKPSALYKEFPEWIIISVPHYQTLQSCKSFYGYENTKYLIEKPLGRTFKECEEIKTLFYDNQLFVGFNYRFLDGVERLLLNMDNNMFGDIISINMILAHGGSPEDRKSWKLDPIKGSSSSLLDPGIHFLDLLLCMFKDVKPICGTSWKGFWNTGVQEEVHLLLKSGKTTINLQTSLVRWKNNFRIEVNGTEGYGIVEGRGKSYGNQTYTTGKRWGWKEENKMQKDTEKLVLETDCSNSFEKEMYDLFIGHTFYNCTGLQAIKGMKLYEDSLKVLKC